MKKKAVIIAAVCGVVLVLAVLAAQPLYLCDIDLPDGCEQAIRAQARGLYSKKLPLVPVGVTVENLSEQTVYYTIHYFPLGTVGMSYDAEHCIYNMEKALTRLQ